MVDRHVGCSADSRNKRRPTVTTVSNGERGRVVDQVEGIVASANERGVHLQGEPDWHNFSKYGDCLAPPRCGARVRLGLDADGFVRHLQVLDDAAANGAPPVDPARDRQIRRISALRSAATFCAGRSVSNDVSSADVLRSPRPSSAGLSVTEPAR
jgi:hypothetical protein